VTDLEIRKTNPTSSIVFFLEELFSFVSDEMALSLHKILTLVKVVTYQLALLVSLGNFSQTGFSQLLGDG
jgi:hypothetical protein